MMENQELMTHLTNLVEYQNDRIDELLLHIERIYAAGLFVIGVASAIFVVLVLYNFFKKFI